eukprot:470372-Amphidinium_carterae.1
MKPKLTWLVRFITTSSALWCWRCTDALKIARRAQAGTRSSQNRGTENQRSNESLADRLARDADYKLKSQV